MSIQSSIYAEYANEVKRGWVNKLRDAIDSPVRHDMIEKVKKVIDEMNSYYFSE